MRPARFQVVHVWLELGTHEITWAHEVQFDDPGYLIAHTDTSIVHIRHDRVIAVYEAKETE